MAKLLIVVEKKSDWSSYYPSDNVVAAMDYLKDYQLDEKEPTQVINLCRSYRYLGTGYYVSLLAEARGHRVIPSVRTINDLSKRAIYGLDIDDLDKRLSKLSIAQEGPDTTSFGIIAYFGKTSFQPLAELVREIFELYPLPLLKIEFKRSKDWEIEAVKPGLFHQLSDRQEDAFAAALDEFCKKVWRRPRSRKKFRYDIAMLHDPTDTLGPSDKRALKRFVDVGKEMGIEVDPITKNDFARLAEYDGLFIRETTRINHHTYRFAKKAEKEDMVVIDDSTSILRCTNKIYLADMLKARKLPTPKTEILYRDDEKKLEEIARNFGYPAVLKIPDGSFSRGVVRVEDYAALKIASEDLFQQSTLLILQEYMPTDFDWRVGVLNNQALYACQYYMSRGHWQIYNHAAPDKNRSGDAKAFPIRQVPVEVVKLALKATQPIGDSLYGVDIKQVGDRLAIIEVNDNPSIDFGVEDEYMGEDLYRRILDEFVRRLEIKRMGLKA